MPYITPVICYIMTVIPCIAVWCLEPCQGGTTWVVQCLRAATRIAASRAALPIVSATIRSQRR